MAEMGPKITPTVEQPDIPSHQIQVISGATTADHPIDERDADLILEAVRKALRDAKQQRKQ
jgi:hypothetical protein